MLPSQQILNQILDYNPKTGQLFWKERPLSMFPNDRVGKTWNTKYANKEAFTAPDAKGYLVGAIFGKNYRASRVIYKMLHGIDADQVDHEDGINQNNRDYNLRDVTGVNNQRNMKRSKANTTGITGVAWNSNKRRWMATIGDKGKNVRKYFVHFDDAVKCRKQMEIDYGYHPNHGR